MNEERRGLLECRRAVDVEQWGKARRGVLLRVGLAVVALCVCASPLQNYAAVRPVLQDHGVFASSCRPNEVVPCQRQAFLLNALSFAFSGGINVLGLGIGWFLDVAGRRKTLLVACGLSLCWVAFGCLSGPGVPMWVQVWALPLLLVLGGLTGVMCFVSAMTYSFDVSRAWPSGHRVFNRGTLNALVPASFNVSTTMAFLLSLFHFRAGVSWPWLMVGLVAATLPLLVALAIFVEPPLPPVDEDAASSKDHVQKRVLSARAAVEGRVLLLVALYAGDALFLLTSTFYMSTLSDHLLWTSPGDPRAPTATTVFSVLLPAWGVVSGLPFSVFLKDRRRLWTAWLIMAAMSVIWCASYSVRSLSLQLVTIGAFPSLALLSTLFHSHLLTSAASRYVTFVFFIPWRGLCFSLTYSTVGSFFPHEWFGRISYTAFTVAGLVTIGGGVGLSKLATSYHCFRALGVGLGVAVTSCALSLCLLCKRQAGRPLP